MPAYLEESREEEARRRVAEERLRIARDLHDVIAHGIATIHMQSGAALHVLERHPEQAGPALAAIKQLSKQTLDELRSTRRCAARDDDEVPLAPTPGLDQLGTLIENARSAGCRDHRRLRRSDRRPCRPRSTSPRTASCRRR